jgi:hypothetical protein
MAYDENEIIRNCELTEDRTTIFLAGLQAQEGLSNDELAFGAICAVEYWLHALEGDTRKIFVDSLRRMTANIKATKRMELDLQRIYDSAIKRERSRARDRERLKRLSQLRDEATAALQSLKISIQRAPKDRFLQKLKGREVKVLKFWRIMEHAHRQPGKVTDTKLAELFKAKCGTAMTPVQAKELRGTVEKLLAPGGVWHGFARQN